MIDLRSDKEEESIRGCEVRQCNESMPSESKKRSFSWMGEGVGGGGVRGEVEMGVGGLGCC